jgi:hypothetical protein
MRQIICAVLVALMAASPAHAESLILTLAEAQIETSPDPNARPPARRAPSQPSSAPSSDIPPLDPMPPPEVITPIGDPKTTTTTTTTTMKPAARTGGLTGIQWVGVGLAVLAVGALAAGGGGGGDEPAPPSSGGN